MYKRNNVKILGIIENMTSFTSGDGVEHFIFGKGGAKKIANQFNIELLAQIPINIEIQKKSDEGTPFLEMYKNDSINKVFDEMIRSIIKNI
jgi:ATP-binding protein involved in chromosome partitioning